jgi:hypothetical protein
MRKLNYKEEEAMLEYEPLCIGGECPKAGQCARVSRPRTKKHFVNTPWDARLKYCQFFKEKERRTDGKDVQTGKPDKPD